MGFPEGADFLEEVERHKDDMVHATKAIEAYWNGIAIGKRDERRVILAGVRGLRTRIELDLAWYADTRPQHGKEFDGDAFYVMATELRACLKDVLEMLPEEDEEVPRR